MTLNLSLVVVSAFLEMDFLSLLESKKAQGNLDTFLNGLSPTYIRGMLNKAERIQDPGKEEVLHEFYWQVFESTERRYGDLYQSSCVIMSKDAQLQNSDNRKIVLHGFSMAAEYLELSIRSMQVLLHNFASDPAVFERYLRFLEHHTLCLKYLRQDIAAIDNAQLYGSLRKERLTAQTERIVGYVLDFFG